MANNKPDTATADTPTVLTNWKAFEDAKLVPVLIRCDGYFPYHKHNEGCHTVLSPTADAMITHFNAGHGGGFYMQLRRSNGSKPWEGWKHLAEAGMEIVDFRCAVCNTEIVLDPRYILPHMVPHRNGNKRTQQGGGFWITISDKPINHDANQY